MTNNSTHEARITNHSSSSKINSPRSFPLNSPNQSWIVRLQVPTSPLYVGSYVRVPVSIEAGSSITFDDLDFSIPAGPPGGQISLSKDVTFNPSLPEVMLLVGYRPGVYTLRCTNLNTGIVVGETRFTISDLWPDDLNGPNLWFNGILPGYSFGATWGGGDPNQPQNMNTEPALGTRRVAVLFVDTTDQCYSTNATTFGNFVNRWDQNLFTGVVEEGIPPR